MISNRLYTVFYFTFFLLALVLSGCLKQSSPLYYHTLASTSSTGSASTRSAEPISTSSPNSGSASAPNLLVGPIRVASFLDQGHLVRKKSAYSLTLAEQHRWAGALPEMITDVLFSNLSLDLGSEKIYTFPNRNNLEGLQLEIHFLHFEEDENGRAKVEARWKIISTETQEILHTETSTYTIEPETNNFDGLVKGLSKGLSLLSNEISRKTVSL
jgi:uncharacterized protein